MQVHVNYRCDQIDATVKKCSKDKSVGLRFDEFKF